ncbi:MAG: RraA family protein [Gammaproteobacteria bacterium]|nr:RraA family protein [Gammaproteobacteria bacterium]
MIEEPPLLRIRAQRPRPTAEQIQALSGVPTGFLTDAMEGRGALNPAIRALSPGILPSQMCGPALTCLCGPADLLAVQGGLVELQPGDVMIAATGGWRDCAVVGDRVVGMLKNCGARGFVTDGLVRDVAGINPVGLPVFCSGVSPNSPFTKGPGEIGFEVIVGGVSISSGDMIVADDDGVVVVPFHRIDQVIESVRHITELEKALDAKVAEGLKVPEAIIELMQSDKVERV